MQHLRKVVVGDAELTIELIVGELETEKKPKPNPHSSHYFRKRSERERWPCLSRSCRSIG